MQEDENITNEVVQYLNTLVIMMNLGLNTPISDQYPYKKRIDKICDD